MLGGWGVVRVQIDQRGRHFNILPYYYSSGIRAVAECLAKVKTDEAQDSCRNLLLMLAQGNPKFQMQVYKGLIALLPCNSPKAQQMAAHALRIVQVSRAPTCAVIVHGAGSQTAVHT